MFLLQMGRLLLTKWVVFMFLLQMGTSYKMGRFYVLITNGYFLQNGSFLCFYYKWVLLTKWVVFMFLLQNEYFLQNGSFLCLYYKWVLLTKWVVLLQNAREQMCNTKAVTLTFNVDNSSLCEATPNKRCKRKYVNILSISTEITSRML